jgi:hypothetical protein
MNYDLRHMVQGPIQCEGPNDVSGEQCVGASRA